MDNVYPVLLTIHSWIRWLVLLTGLWALINAFMGMQSHGPMTSRAPFSAFMGSLHVQVLLGIALFAVMGMSGMAPFPDGPRSSFGWEHLGMALIAAVFATLANRASKPPRGAVPPVTPAAVRADGTVAPAPAAAPLATNDAARWRNTLIWTVLAWIPLLLLIPWWRPMLRMLGAQ
ncbi:hypothetical protein [Deinococcus sp. Marseille-Q6407]|uniref:hypothetical protein n=1 Tax=Deinococcus sp. Marseille-Q6407 TaxID=2969223 RepID=UPI0021C0AE5A|nr:hypothetical protein [Deinococcus sp. Marseille-Q6407]